jgi:HEAT repeat protein
MRLTFSYAVAGFLCWATLTPVLAQKPDGPPGPNNNPSSENKITANSKLDGKTLREWVAEIKANDPSVQRTAIQAVMNYGAVARNDAVPAIISVLNRERASEVSVKVNGVMALGFLGMNEKDLKSGVGCLINLLGDREAIVRRYAVGALASLGPDARSAIPSLVNLTKSKEDSETRQAAVNALGIMAWDKARKEGPDARAFRAITEALSDHSIQVRSDALKALIMITPSNSGGRISNADRTNAIGKLEGLLVHKDKSEAVWAHLALMLLDSARLNDANVKAMVKILKLGDSRVRCNAAQALGGTWRLANMPPNGPITSSITPKSSWGMVISDLIELLSEKDLSVVFNAINALGEFGSAAMKAKPKLGELAQHKDPLIQKAAVLALEKITGRQKANLGEAKQTGP